MPGPQKSPEHLGHPGEGLTGAHGAFQAEAQRQGAPVAPVELRDGPEPAGGGPRETPHLDPELGPGSGPWQGLLVPAPAPCPISGGAQPAARRSQAGKWT